MSDDYQIDLIWLSELNLAVLYPAGDFGTSFVAAAIIVKGEDGTDSFVPYDGFIQGAPIGFSLGQDPYFSISVLAFRSTGEPVELVSLQLDEDLVPHLYLNGQDEHEVMGMHVVGFGERRHMISGGEQGEIGLSAQDYDIEGSVDYSDLLAAFLDDMRHMEDERFTGFFITAVPRSDGVVGPAVHLKPLNHYQFGVSVRTLEMEVEGENEGEPFGEPLHFSFAETAIFSRHDSVHSKGRSGAFRVRDVPEFTLHAGPARQPVDFILRNGFQIHWRRQLEAWTSEGEFTGFDGRLERDVPSFVMQPIVERDCLRQHQGMNYFHWLVEEAVIGDVVGVVFASENASIDLRVLLAQSEELPVERFALFMFMGDEFVPITEETLQLAENQGIASRLEQHITHGLKQLGVQNYLYQERVLLAGDLLKRDQLLQNLFGPQKLETLAKNAPFGPELMVYRDHILRVAHRPDMALWLEEIFRSSLLTGRSRLVDSLKFENFIKAPALAHALVFNEAFCASFHGKPLDPHSMRMPVLEYLLSKLYSDSLIEWAMRLRGESQAILWHLALKRPHMVERLYDLKLEPDVALNPFDDKSLDHAEGALSDSSHIDVAVIEGKVLPILKTLDDERQIRALQEFANGLKYGAEGKALNIGELSVCLGAVEQAEAQWQSWLREGGEIFRPLMQPLELDVASFAEGQDFSPPSDLVQVRREIGHLIERLGNEFSFDDEARARAHGFIDQVEAEILLAEIKSKLDLALKYHHDLMIGVQQLYEKFNYTEDELSQLLKIKEEEWPSFEMFGPTFAEPFLRQQVALKETFEKSVADFAHSVHPDDELFHKTLKNALWELEAALPKLVWLEAGQALSRRVRDAQTKLHRALLEVKPYTAKLRRSKPIANAVRHMVVAERMGPSGWPIVHQSLETIEKNLAAVEA